MSELERSVLLAPPPPPFKETRQRVKRRERIYAAPTSGLATSIVVGTSATVVDTVSKTASRSPSPSSSPSSSSWRSHSGELSPLRRTSATSSTNCIEDEEADIATTPEDEEAGAVLDVGTDIYDEKGPAPERDLVFVSVSDNK
jgi:hypothetical protein